MINIYIQICVKNSHQKFVFFNFFWKYIKIIYFLKKSYLISVHQNDLKNTKKINLK
jgi:hypothetical protein